MWVQNSWCYRLKKHVVILGLHCVLPFLPCNNSDCDMQSTFSATSESCYQELDSDESEGEEGGGGGEGRVQESTTHMAEVAPVPLQSDVNKAAFSDLKMNKSHRLLEQNGAMIGRNNMVFTYRKQFIHLCNLHCHDYNCKCKGEGNWQFCLCVALQEFVE